MVVGSSTEWPLSDDTVAWLLNLKDDAPTTWWIQKKLSKSPPNQAERFVQKWTLRDPP